ncbi:MAG TPA: hypothetical protein DD618_01300, partial [Acholeplasmatales bacterium]|nr:hypothetical protein [Acholeplasmatales bacterium]
MNLKKALLLVFVLLFMGIICIRGVPIQASSPLFPIDTDSKMEALSSIKYIFENWESIIQEDDLDSVYAWKLYFFATELQSMPSATENQIKTMLDQRGILYANNFSVPLLYLSFSIEKTPYFFSTSSYLGESSFTDDFESVNFRIDVTYYGDPNITPDSFDKNFAQDFLGFELINEVESYGPFLRYFNLPLAYYGDVGNYEDAKIEIDYSSSVVLNLASITLIDNDKLIIEAANQKLYVHRNQHYGRNASQQIFPNNENSFLNLYGNDESLETPRAYFHQLGLFDGDTSNFNNIKYTLNPETTILQKWPNSTSEVIYDLNGNIDVNALVMGTFNFYSSSISLNLHYLYDVYPYLFWGN